MHFFRTPKIHLDCFTSRADVVEYAPVVNAMEVIPSWWKALPKENAPNLKDFHPTPTMKTCAGMYEYYEKSIALPLWSDLAISVDNNKEYRWQFSDSATAGLVHNYQQHLGFLDSDDQAHLKICSPWAFKTKSNVDWVMAEALYNRKTLRGYTTLPGILNFYKQSGTNIQMFIDISSPGFFTIPFGSVFLLTPMSDKKVVVHRHLIDEPQFKKILTLHNQITFINKYKTIQKTIKCPYKDNTK
jgi:hypothetical protein